MKKIFAGIVGQTILLFLWGFAGLVLLFISLHLNEIDAIPLEYGAAILLAFFALVCFLLAKFRINAKQEKEFRYIQQIDHLAQLEEKIGQRTSELDQRNRQLSSEVAERLDAEAQLKQSNELLTGIISTFDGIIYVVDFDTYEILFANDYLRNLFGFDPMGKKCHQFIHSAEDKPCMFCNNERLLGNAEKNLQPLQWEYQNPFNKKWYRAKDQVIKWSDGRPVKLEIAIDITEQKSIEHFLQEARRQAEMAMGMRSRLVAMVAHDLKSPFYSMTQMLKRILAREHFDHDIHRQFLENIVINGQRMLQMIDNLLSMDRLETGGIKLEKSFFNVHEMAREVLQNFTNQAFDKAIRTVNSIPPGSEVFADRHLYFVVLNNLMSNAIKFSRRSGTVGLFLPDSQRPMSVAVRDNGAGMSRDYADNLFRADIKTSSKGTKGETGSGLGLLFCNGIIEAHHGRILVESEEGVGSTFVIQLPECSKVTHEEEEARLAAF
ncbi:MAG: PAS domain-containing protein [Desulfofustis sp.]|nr:PAS domain-containing protein [Desulfofustis sp.]